jgi:transcriptional regulator with XRE-family HTH domain
MAEGVPASAGCHGRLHLEHHEQFLASIFSPRLEAWPRPNAVGDALAVADARRYIGLTMSENFRAYCKIGERIASLARTQTELGRVLGVAQQSVSKKLRGECAILLSDLEKLARHYDIPLTFFFEAPDGAPEPAGYREFADMTPDAREIMHLANALPKGELRKLLAMAKVFAGDTDKARKPARPSAS